ncbi:hypothetical protein [uncultured Microbacterium sp.]|uniref:hypothetical protein n=1 Tax=uncultured Microbacterium sp. TaxID=191216 RepID=UPI0030FC7923
MRSISLPTWVADLLMTRYETSGPDGPVFRNTHGGRLTVDLAEKKFRAICDEAGLPSIASTTCDTLR